MAAEAMQAPAGGSPAGAGGARRREPLIPTSVLGMLLFVASEAMLFSGLISAHAILRASQLGGVWPPPGQPRLPAESTAFNTALLLASGVVLFFAGRAFARKSAAAGRLMVAALLLGAAFVALQGVEWVRLIRQGLTMVSSAHGSFFYLIVGLHALHAVAAIAGLAWIVARLRAGTLRSAQLQAAQVFWYFVVGMWPFLYWRVYF